MTSVIDELIWYKNGFEKVSAGMVVLLLEDFLNRRPFSSPDPQVKRLINESERIWSRIIDINAYIERLISHQSKNDTDDALKRVIIDRYIKQVVKDTNEIKTQMIAMIEEVIANERNQNEV